MKFIFSVLPSVTGANEPLIEVMTPAAMKNDAASIQKGRKIAIATRKLPIGGPMKVLVRLSALQSLPFALSSLAFSTTSGRKV